MKLIDRIAQCQTPLVVTHSASTQRAVLSGARDHAAEIKVCATRFVLSDELTRLCTALAFSRGARTFTCADLLRIPAESVWVEWCEAPWKAELSLYGFKHALKTTQAPVAGRRGVLIRASRDGRRGWLRTFWDGADAATGALASSMEAYFDFDTPEDEAPEPPGDDPRESFQVRDAQAGKTDILSRYFRFRYEQSWGMYYDRELTDPVHRAAVAHHALGTIAIAVPVLLSFFLLLGTRVGLPRRDCTLGRLNRSRLKAGKSLLLDHIEVFSPLLPYNSSITSNEGMGTRRSPRYHHVRGHLVRRGNEVFWRMPHVRGSLTAGRVRSRTVTWSVAPDASRTLAGETLSSQSA